ncbi:MAG TPA: sulfotransferase [Thermoleophilaceae bacterium]|nr:sulfotransferase [Thermoleophilaceae bacterium]
MKVIGAGFGRTGTMSLKGALEQLGFGPSFHMIDVARYPELLPQWQAAADGESADWEKVFEGWESTVDWPACTYWEQIWETFPDAKVLLSVRDPESWYASCQKSIHASAQAAAKGELEGGSVTVSPEAMKMINGVIWNGTFDGRFDDKEFALDVYNRHNEDVKSKVPADKLLVYEIKQGWEPLCEFLEVPVPETDMPHLNDATSFRAMVGLPALS